jgi:hypothetical protein
VARRVSAARSVPGGRTASSIRHASSNAWDNSPIRWACCRRTSSRTFSIRRIQPSALTDEDEAGEEEAGEEEAGEEEAGEDEAGEDEAGEDEAGEDEAGEDEAGEEEAGEGKTGEDEAGEED